MTFHARAGSGRVGRRLPCDDLATRELLATVSIPSPRRVEAERAFLRAVGVAVARRGGARTHRRRPDQYVGHVRHEELSRIATTHDEADLEDAGILAERLAETLLERVEQG